MPKKTLLTTFEFQAKLDAKGLSVQLVGDYLGVDAPSKFICDSGHETVARPRAVLASHHNGCSVCGKQGLVAAANAGKFAKGKAFFESEFIRIYGSRAKLLTPYIGAKRNITIMCENGHEYTSCPQKIRYLEGCIQCRGNPAITRFSNAYPDKLYAKYQGRVVALEPSVGSYVPIRHLCQVHGEFLGSPQALLYRRSYHGCTKCNLVIRGLNHRVPEGRRVGASDGVGERLERRQADFWTSFSKHLQEVYAVISSVVQPAYLSCTNPDILWNGLK